MDTGENEDGGESEMGVGWGSSEPSSNFEHSLYAYIIYTTGGE